MNKACYHPSAIQNPEEKPTPVMGKNSNWKF